MAQFDKVTYTYYTQTLGRSVVPSEEEFNAHKLENVLQMQQYIDDGLVKEKQTDGYSAAICLWIEEDFKASQTETGADAIDASETIGSYSHTVNTKAHDLFVEKNNKSVAQKKYKWLGFYCDILS